MKHALLLLATLASLCVQAQDPNLQWLRTAGGFSQYEQYRSTTDGSGHLYTVGLGSDMNFGSGFTVAGDAIAIARYDVSGTIGWARALTTAVGEAASVSSITTTTSDELWIAGYFSSPTLTLDGFTLNNAATSSAFIARFNSSGSVVFAIAWGGSGDSFTYATDLCTDDLDRVYVVGHSAASSFSVGAVTLTNPTVAGQVYALKFDATGTTLWGTMSNAPAGAQGLCIATDGPGNVYAVCLCAGVFTIGDETVDTGVLNEALLVRLSPGGDAEQVHALAECYPLDLAVDAAGNAYVSGYIETTAVFGTDILVPSVLDGFVAAYASDGSYRWVVGVQGEIDNELCWSVALDAEQTGLVVGGTFVFSALFGDVPMSTGLSSTDGFIMRLDTAGGVGEVMDMTGDGPTLFAQVGLDAEDHLYASGVTQSTGSYLGEPIQNGSGNNAFLARFDDITTGVSNVARGSVPRLYPDPCAGAFTVDLPPDARAVIITDVQGREQQNVPVQQMASSSFRIGVPGVYFVTIITGTGRAVRRVVVE